ncbi:MAG: hypothetical protein AAGF12_10505 [Myxococcota bacterium]
MPEDHTHEDDLLEVSNGVGRRRFARTLVSGAVGAAAVAAAPVSAQGPTAPSSEQVARVTRERILLGIEAGHELELQPDGPRWRVEAVYDLQLGAVPVVLRGPTGARFQVDVLRRDASPGAPSAIADAGPVSVFLANHGDGAKATDEEQGLGAMALARSLRAADDDASMLLTFRERLLAHPDGAFEAR